MLEELKGVIQYWMEGEINGFIKVWLSAYLSLTYCYIAAKILPAFLLVVCVFLRPLQLHLIGTTSFLSWLASFKLLMLAFDVGPLSLSLSLDS